MRSSRVLVDSCIWIDHINNGDAELIGALKRRRVLLHPMIVGEVALGSITNRQAILQDLKVLPQAPSASHAEVVAMIEWLELHNTGIGYVDAHLLAATRQLKDTLLWTRAKRLRAQAKRLEIAYTP